MDRASDCGSGGRRFDSCRAHKIKMEGGQGGNALVSKTNSLFGITGSTPVPSASMKKLQEHIKTVNKERGWEDTTVPELFMYLSEEVGESAKAARQLMNSRIDSKSENFELGSELADVLSYVLDIANRFDIDLEKAYWDKEEINKKRTWSKS